MTRSTIVVAFSLLFYAFSASAAAVKRQASVPVYSTCSVSNTFALTFDDGVYVYGDSLMNTLSQSQAKASFFINGNNWACIYDQADALKARYAAGHHIANHGWGHAHMTQGNEAQINQQLQLVEEAMIKILGVKPKWFRPPYGEYNALLLKVLADRGYSGLVYWSQDSGDSASPQPSASTIISRYQSYPARTIVLNHETYSLTVNDVMPKVVPQLKSKYSLVSVPQCLGISSNPSDWYQYVQPAGTRDATWTCSGKPGPGQL